MDEQRQDDQQEPIYNSSVPIQDRALKTCRDDREGGEKGSGRSVLAARQDDDSWEISGLYVSKNISLNVNVVTPQEFELTYYECRNRAR